MGQDSDQSQPLLPDYQGGQDSSQSQPLLPLNQGDRNLLKVPLLKGDLGGFSLKAIDKRDS